MAQGGRLTTHVLDLVRGCPACGLRVDLYRIEGAERVHLASLFTNADGRLDSPLLEEGALREGTYELVFHAGDYQRAEHIQVGKPLFLEEIPVRFAITDASRHYHVPLLLSAFGYTTYRGS